MSMNKRTKLTFKQKLFGSYLLVFLAFLIFLFPFASQSVRTIVRKTFKQRLLTLIAQISAAPSVEGLVERLKDQEPLLFIRVTLLTSDREILYDSALPSQSYQIEPEQEFQQSEFLEALSGGTGYSEGYSTLLGQKLIYVVRSFDFHGQRLVLRTAFPYNQVDSLIGDFEMGFLALGSAVLLLFAIMMWIIINHLSRPIHTIVSAIKPYQEGSVDTIGKIDLLSSQSEFSQLADTLNSLNERIQSHINTLTQERNSKEIILDSLGEGIIAVSGTSDILFVNAIAAQLLQTERHQMIGKKIECYVQGDIVALITRCLKEHQPQAGSLTLKDKRKFLELLAVPIVRNEGAVLVLQDKSSHYRIIEMGKDFVANASHELKTPITIIRGFAETLSEHRNLPEPMAQEIIGKILKNCQRMETLVKNLLTLADIEKLPLVKMQDFDLLPLIENCKQMTQSVWADARITIAVSSADLHVTADPDLLELAVINLLSNAAKYCMPPAQIEVRLWEKAETVYIAVSDRGIGIPPEDLDNIFDRFYTVDKTHSRRLGGAGLGLAITKTIIEKHEGKISVSSVLGAGSTFTIALPKRYE